jgi:hypothetical protein
MQFAYGVHSASQPSLRGTGRGTKQVWVLSAEDILEVIINGTIPNVRSEGQTRNVEYEKVTTSHLVLADMFTE